MPDPCSLSPASRCKRGFGVLLLGFFLSGCGSSVPSPATSGSNPPTVVAGLELVRVTGELALENAVPGSEDLDDATEGQLLVRIEDDAREGETLVAPITVGGMVLGWASTSGAAQLTRVEPICPEVETNVPLLARLGASAIFCHGAEPFAFPAYLPAFCGVGGGLLAEGMPDWLTGLAPGTVLYGEDPPGSDDSVAPASGQVFARLPPGLALTNCDAEVGGRWHRVTAHYDDPAAAQCRTRWIDETGVGVVDEDPAVSVARCRLTLVISGAEPVPDRWDP